MAFRSVIINHRAKLSYSLNYMIVRRLEGEDRVVLDEVKTIIINSMEVSITSALISELSQRKIKLIICNEKCNPECEMISYQNNYYSYRKLKEQISFSDDYKNNLWKEITKQKIFNQAQNLKLKNKIESYTALLNYQKEVELGDITNREGHAAKVYFNSLFGVNFSRRSEDVINKYLNYGYSIILSAISRTIKSLGYLTELGIHHIGESNSFNLSCDLIEPLRPLVDSLVLKKIVNDDNFKEECVRLLERKVMYKAKEFFLDNAIEQYVEDLLAYLKTGDEGRIHFIQYEV